MHPRFRVEDDDTLVVSDPITRRQYPLGTDPGIDPEPVDVGEFWYPVSNAVAIETSVLRLPTTVSTFVRNARGEMLARCEYDSSESFPEGEYVLDVHPPIKLYVLASGPLDVERSKTDGTIEFDRTTRIRIGVRSYHKQPGTTVTTTEDPTDVMAAISTFGSALKTTSPERSFPTLRGHPPGVELGDELLVPDLLEVPDVGVRLELPPDFDHVLPAASLAFYLGAEVVPGTNPWLVTDEGFCYDLSPEDNYQSEVERILQQVFLLDCITRTEGLYPVDLRERTIAEERLDFDFATLYNVPLAERIEHYLSVEFDVLQDLMPTWRLAVDCRPEADVIEYLPYAADDLAFVRPFTPEPPVEAPEMVATVDEFTRNPQVLTRSTGNTSREGGGLIRSGGTASEDFDERIVEVQSRDTLEAVWAGSGRVFRGGKMLLAGYENLVERGAIDGDIEVAVVCNDQEMAGEYEDEILYSDLKALPVTVHEYTNLTTAELRKVLSTRFDFLHYIGHVEDDAFVCSDGNLSVEEIDSVGPFAFLLNGCKSYRQGVQMIERGSVAGIVTNNDVGNNGAIVVGQQLVRLLNCGFSVQSSLSIIQQVALVSNAYVSLGAPNYSLIQMEDGIATVIEYEERKDGFKVWFHEYPSSRHKLGTMAISHLGDNPKFSIASGIRQIPGVIPGDWLAEELERKGWPVFLDDDLVWNHHRQL